MFDGIVTVAAILQGLFNRSAYFFEE